MQSAVDTGRKVVCGVVVGVGYICECEDSVSFSVSG